MIICVCHRVSDRDIAGAVRAGCASFDALQEETRVATACGACHECAREAFHEHRACSRADATVSWPVAVVVEA
jgi:bacterioferritin-associated ferredoxin